MAQEEQEIQTDSGGMTIIYEITPINGEDIYIAWFKEKPEIIVEARSFNEAKEELLISLKVWLDHENKK